MASGTGVQYLPTAGESKVPQWTGVYDAYIAVNVNPADTTGTGQVRLRVPQVFGQTVSGWATPAVPVGYIPKVGTQVSAMFIGGDPSRPVWLGNFAEPIPPPVTINAGPPGDTPGTQVGEIWYDSADGMASYEWNGASWIKYQISTGGLAAGIGIDEPNITGGTITGGTFIGTNWVENSSGSFFYNGTPAAGNILASISNVAGTDQYNNPWSAGIYLYGPSGSSVGIIDNGDAAAIQLQPPGVTQLSDVPQVYAFASNQGASSETQYLIMSSGATDNQDSAQIQLQGAAGDGSSPAQIQFLFGSTAKVTFTETGVGAVDTWHDFSTELVNWVVASGGLARYRMMPDNTVMIHCTNLAPTTTPPVSGTFWNIPSGYQDTSGVTYNFPVAWAASGGVTLTAEVAVYVRGSFLEVGTPIPSNIVGISFVIRYPLD